MRLLLHHPALARVRCSDCAKYVYDEHWKRETFEAGSVDNILPVLRHGPTPCQSGVECPKGSPEQEHEHLLSRRNDRMLAVYLESKATGHRRPADKLRRWAFSFLDSIYSDWERQDLAEKVIYQLARALAK